jgi:hypothetical protein
MIVVVQRYVGLTRKDPAVPTAIAATKGRMRNHFLLRRR